MNGDNEATYSYKKSTLLVQLNRISIILRGAGVYEGVNEGVGEG